MATKTKRSAVITPDGFLDLPEFPQYSTNDEYGAPQISGHMVVPSLDHDADIARASELAQRGILQIIGKSGGSRVGLEVIPRADEQTNIEHHTGRIIVPVSVLSLRAVQVRQNGVRDDLLRVLCDMAKETKHGVAIGRLALVAPEDALSKAEVLQAVLKHQLALPAGMEPEQCVDEQGCLVLPLDQLHFVLCEANFRTEEKRKVLRYGKHGLQNLQEERDGLPPYIGGKQFFVGGVRLSIGPFIAIIDAETNTPGVVHLAARVFDGIRTSGLKDRRHVEMFNKNFDGVRAEDIRIRIRLYHANKDIQEFGRRVINARTIENGVTLSDVIELGRHPERLFHMMGLVHPSVASGNPGGYFVGPGKAHKVEWVDHASPGFQNSHLEMAAPKFSAGDPDYMISGREMPEPCRDLAKLLGYVGQDQSHSKMYFQWGFPDTDTMRAMKNAGVGVFVAHDVRMPEDAYSTAQPSHRPTINNPFFHHQEFVAFKKLHEAGARFFMVRHESPDAFHEKTCLPEEVLEWHERGFWVRPEAKDRIESVDTLIAMYGSHVEGMDQVLHEQITRFALRMQKRFGSTAGFIHGKGPGVMYVTDTVARNLPELANGHADFSDVEPMISIGVGIDLEQQHQAINFHPDGQLDFAAHDRLVRQKHMNDRATFNVFNLGGGGTLEEVALSLCSQKLYKNLLTPLIFVDTFGVGPNGTNYWDQLKKFIDDMSETKKITRAEADEGLLNIKLIQGHMKNMLHIVDSYDEAADIIERFADDPVGYYVDAGVVQWEFDQAFAGGLQTRENTHFPMPHWMNEETYITMRNDERWVRQAA